MAPCQLEIGQMYSRREIHDLVGGGSVQAYLPEKGGVVLCGCFVPRINARAPQEIDVGNKPKVIRSAKRLATQKGEIPVFVKLGSKSWQYVGMYRAVGYTDDRAELSARADFRDDAVGILFLAPTALPDSAIGAGDIEFGEFMEGALSLRQHLRKERQPGLSRMKRMAVLRSKGKLTCEACGLDFTGRDELWLACCEVHHTRPLSTRIGAEPTRLEDLAILCANCHRMIHRTDPMMSVEDFRGRLDL